MKRITDEGVSAAATPQADLLADLEEEREALAEREHHLAAVEEALEARQVQVAEARRKLEATALEALDGEVPYSTMTRVGDPIAEILRAEKELGIDLESLPRQTLYFCGKNLNKFLDSY
jgi:predicted component of type VI protein secretion system